METPAATDHAPFGTLLREARKLRHRSQLDLALQAEVSQRHLSFLESGRAQPSRAMVVTLAEALDLSMRERNRLLNSAGFAGIYPQRRLEAADMAPVREALTMMLRHHEPFPAIVVDRAWNLFSANTAMQRLLAVIDDVDALWGRTCGDAPQNVLKLILHPEGLRPLILNLDEIVPPLLARTAREAMEHAEIQPVLDTVLAYPGLPRRFRQIDLGASRLPVLPTHFRVAGQDLRLFTTLTTFGTPLDVTTDELRVESMFPADEPSRALLVSLSQA
jgi:transcriptional regulator with XRE-family HTH domain